MTRWFRYILVDDNGMAPCVTAGLMTLATCKPQIRRTAAAGDWVSGFMPSPHERGLLVYAGRVGRVLDWADYEKAFRGRDDAIYRPGPLGIERLRPDYHESGRKMEKDLSAPVLVFERDAFWYFGNSPQVLPHRLLPFAAAGQGHRVKGTTEEDCKALEAWLKGNWPPGVHGQPRARRTAHRASSASRSRCD